MTVKNQKNTAYLFTPFLLFFLLLPTIKDDLIGKSPQLIGISPDSLKKNHLIFVFIPSCSHCRKAAVRLQPLFEKDSNITGLTASNFEGEVQAFKDSFKISFPIVTIERPRLRKYFKDAPRFVYVKDSIITAVLDSIKFDSINLKN
jgi:hypothetical protein